ncbi:hypothetical protein [Methylococcus mesophilus]|uniref:hypothetical protein n=1 Tax=Methylococcus mesophilus TaxID=2993564 RepID=UPI00224A7AEE|nr:hypothetical protein [Methylococcus mesophilus]UZR28570.1 hypothetical protein OOT43_17915 [Methylococcus mesophilus]
MKTTHRIARITLALVGLLFQVNSFGDLDIIDPLGTDPQESAANSATVICEDSNVNERTSVNKFITTCANGIVDSTCRIYIEKACVNGVQVPAPLEDFINEHFPELGFEPVTTTQSLTRGDFVGGDSSMYAPVTLPNGRKTQYCSKVNSEQQFKEIAAGIDAPPGTYVASTPAVLKPNPTFAAMTLHWTEYTVTDRKTGNPKTSLLVEILDSYNVHSYVRDPKYRKPVAAYSIEGDNWAEVIEKMKRSRIKCKKQEAITDKDWPRAVFDPKNPEGYPTNTPGLNKVLYKAQEGYMKLHGSLHTIRMREKLREVLGEPPDGEPALSATPAAERGKSGAAPAGYTPKDPAQNYAGTPCEPFTQPAAADGSSIYGNGSVVVYGKRAYRCETQNGQKLWTLYGPREKLGKDWKNYEAARLEQ